MPRTRHRQRRTTARTPGPESAKPHRCAPPGSVRPFLTAAETSRVRNRAPPPEDAPTYTERMTRLRLRVSPGAGRAAIVGRDGEAGKVRVTEPPEDGRANDAVLRLLAGALAVPRTALTLVSGHGARDKIVELAGVGPALAERRLSSASANDRSRTGRPSC